MHHKLRRHNQLQIASDGHEAIPAIISVGAVATSAHEGDFAVTELVEMPQGKFGGTLLVEDDVRYTVDLAMAGDKNRGENAKALFESGVDEDEALDGAIHEQAGILLNEVWLAAVTCGEVEIALFNKVLFDAAKNLHGIAVAEFGNEDADGEGLAFAQGSREEAGTVVEFCRSLGNAIARFLRDGADSGSVVQDQRDGGGRQVEVLAKSSAG